MDLQSLSSFLPFRSATVALCARRPRLQREASSAETGLILEATAAASLPH